MSQYLKWLTKEEINKINVTLISKNNFNGQRKRQIERQRQRDIDLYIDIQIYRLYRYRYIRG